MAIAVKIAEPGHRLPRRRVTLAQEADDEPESDDAELNLPLEIASSAGTAVADSMRRVILERPSWG